MIKAVVFDLDDTIYDYEFCHKKAMKRLKEYCIRNLAVDEEEFEENFDIAKNTVKKRLGDVGASHNRILYMQNFLEQIGKKPVVYSLDLYNEYWDEMLDVMQPFDYVIPLFQQLMCKDIRIAVLTDLTAQIQHRKIQRLGIAEYIDVIVTSEEAGREKPDISMFQLVSKKLGLQSEEILMVGDSYKKDILGAEAFGMQSIHYRKEQTDDIIEKCLELIGVESEK